MIEKQLAFFEKDPRFRFDPDKHEYYYMSEDLKKRVQTFRSATNLLDDFKKPFDSDFWSKKKAEDTGVSQQEILDQWSTKGKKASGLGHSVHEWVEYYRKGEELPIPKDDPEIEPLYSVGTRIHLFKSVHDTRLHKIIPLRQEFKVFSRKWGIAGTMDDLGFVKLSDGLIVGDWKTNEKFHTDSDFKGRYNKMLYPFEDLWQNELNSYSIQVSLYRLLLEEEAGIKTKEGFICWIGPTETKLFKTLDLRDRLRKYLNKNNLSI
jgi:hypothetical protein